MPLPKFMLRGLCDVKICAVFVLSFIVSVCAPDKATLKVQTYVALVLIWWYSHHQPCGSVSSCCMFDHAFTRLWENPNGPWAQERSLYRSVSSLVESALNSPWRVAPCLHSILSVAWTVMSNLTKLRRIRSRRWLLVYSVTFWVAPCCVHFPTASSVLGPMSRNRVADILHHVNLFRVLLVLGSSLLFFTSVLCRRLCTSLRLDFAHLWDFTPKSVTTRAVVDVPNEPSSLSRHKECSSFYEIFSFFWGHATLFPRRNHLPQDFITLVFLWSPQ